MQPAQPVLALPSADIPQLPLPTWAEACAQALSGGERVLTLYGRPDANAHWLVTAVLQRQDGQLHALRARADRGESYPSLTAAWPALQMFERELWEQTGLVPAAHPWLKPLRHEGQYQQRMNEYPFFSVRGQQVHEVGVGPIHASVIEPGHFRFMCHGEQVLHLEIQLGYQHRGVEALLLQRPVLGLGTLVESIAGDSSIAYAAGYCAAVEALAGVALDMAAQRVRGIALELERVAMHLASLAGLATDIAFLQGGATYGRLRTAIINATMRVCGSRFGRGWLRPGGVRHGISAPLRHDLLQALDKFARDFAEVNELMLGARSVRARFQGIGVLGRQAALEIGAVGLPARASGVAADARCDLPGALHTEHPITLQLEQGGDCWARMRLRMREIDESLRWLRLLLEAPDIELSAGGQAAIIVPRPGWLCVTVQEGFRGPVVQALETGPDARLLHYKVQDPSMQNWFGLALAVRNNAISDFPICNKSFDLSYCGNDL